MDIELVRKALLEADRGDQYEGCNYCCAVRQLLEHALGERAVEGGTRLETLQTERDSHA